MAALTEDRITDSKEMNLKGYRMLKGDTIYKGSLVALDSTTGYVKPAGAATAAATDFVVGVASETVVSPAADVNGDKMVRVRSGRAFEVTHALAVVDLGKVTYATDDQTVGIVASTNPKAGIFVERITSTRGFVYIPLGGAK